MNEFASNDAPAGNTLGRSDMSDGLLGGAGQPLQPEALPVSIEQHNSGEDGAHLLSALASHSSERLEVAPAPRLHDAAVPHLQVQLTDPGPTPASGVLVGPTKTAQQEVGPSSVPEGRGNVASRGRKHHLLRHTLALEDMGENSVARMGASSVLDAARMIQTMSQRELQHSFEQIYKVRSSSNNNNWLRRKLLEAINPQGGPDAEAVKELLQQELEIKRAANAAKQAKRNLSSPPFVPGTSRADQSMPRSCQGASPFGHVFPIDRGSYERDIGYDDVDKRKRRAAAAGVAVATAAVLRDPDLEALERIDRSILRNLGGRQTTWSRDGTTPRSQTLGPVNDGHAQLELAQSLRQLAQVLSAALQSTGHPGLQGLGAPLTGPMQLHTIAGLMPLYNEASNDNRMHTMGATGLHQQQLGYGSFPGCDGRAQVSGHGHAPPWSGGALQAYPSAMQAPIYPSRDLQIPPHIPPSMGLSPDGRGGPSQVQQQNFVGSGGSDDGHTHPPDDSVLGRLLAAALEDQRIRAQEEAEKQVTTAREVLLQQLMAASGRAGPSIK